MKNTNYINWDQYFMGLAILSAKRSKDPKTQVGACIVNKEHKILGIGYNGFPIGCSDEDLPWSDAGDYSETKYAYVVHAEVNAVLNSNLNLKDSILYVTLFPCNECMKVIIQAGVKEIVYLSNRDAGKQYNIASVKMMEQAGIVARKIEFEPILLKI